MTKVKEIFQLFCGGCGKEFMEMACTSGFTPQAIVAFCGVCKEPTRWKPKGNKAENLRKIDPSQTTLFAASTPEEEQQVIDDSIEKEAERRAAEKEARESEDSSED